MGRLSMKVLVFDSEKTDGYAKHAVSTEDAHTKAKEIIYLQGYNVDDWELYEESDKDDIAEGYAEFVYSHPYRHETITLFEV